MGIEKKKRVEEEKEGQARLSKAESMQHPAHSFYSPFPFSLSQMIHRGGKRGFFPVLS